MAGDKKKHSDIVQASSLVDNTAIIAKPEYHLNQTKPNYLPKSVQRSRSNEVEKPISTAQRRPLEELLQMPPSQQQGDMWRGGNG